jgi:hypothetical protein
MAGRFKPPDALIKKLGIVGDCACTVPEVVFRCEEAFFSVFCTDAEGFPSDAMFEKDKLSATIAAVGKLPSPKLELRKSGKGKYNGMFFPEHLGELLLAIQIGGRDLVGSPFHINVVASNAVAFRCSAVRKMLMPAVVDPSLLEWVVLPFASVAQPSRIGETINFCVSLRDEHGVSTDNVPGGLRVWARYRRSDENIQVVMAHSDVGQHDGHFEVTTSGTVELHVGIQQAKHIVNMSPVLGVEISVLGIKSQGLRVLAIRPHGSAHHAGISVGDWIHSIQRNDGTWRDLSSKENFEAIIEKKIPGDVIRIRLYALRCVSAQRLLGAAAPLLLPVTLP